MDNISKYLNAIKALIARGNATEHSYRPALIELIESFGKGVRATNEPKRVAAGAPDLIITHGQIPLGYIETKDIGIDLDKELKSDQMKRYLKGLNNLILTDYLNFRWYESGELRLSVELAKIGPKKGLLPVESGIESFKQLVNEFLSTRIHTIDSPKVLAAHMASLAQLIRDIILKAFEDEDNDSSLQSQLDGFRKVLLHDLEKPQFADMYAQTICYGLFAARCNHEGPKPFTREKAAFELPETNPFLAEMFDHIAGPRLDKRLTWIVDHLAELLNRADMTSILRDFVKRSRREDPVVHFYETFLAAYDPKMREARGVYYTPEPVVSYIVRSIDHILKTDFNLPDGLADTSKVDLYKNTETKAGKIKREKSGECHKVLILDPAVGTGTFLFGVIDQIHEQVIAKGGKGMWSGYVSKHLLPRLFGFELLMAPYAVAHMKLGLQLKETGYDFNSGERLKIYLTNTLEESQQLPDLGLFANKIAKEANAAGNIKSEAPVMVILGNPPYSGHSANKGEWIAGLLRGKDSITGLATENYFEVDGKPLGERNPKWLNDDYVKFIRFGQWRIEQTGYGIIAMITNHGYLDNPTFRGMRQSLMKTFDKIYILNLHGNSRKKEMNPDGTKDENVFDIQQGVAICILIKKQTSPNDKVIKYAHVYGSREFKYKKLMDNQISTTSWQLLNPETSLYLYIEQNVEIQQEYQKGWNLAEILPLTLLGPNSHRDSFALAFDYKEAKKRIKDFFNEQLDDQEIRDKYQIVDTRDWSLQKARISRKKDIEPVYCLYRPFDFRYMLYGSYAFDYHRPELNDNMLYKNLAIISTRQTKEPFSILATNKPVGQHKLVTPYDGSYLSPLYLYANLEKRQTDAFTERGLNFSANFQKAIVMKSGFSIIPNGRGNFIGNIGPEDVFHYMYAVFHSPAYRKRYAEFLKIDFPRLPLTSNKDLFRKLCGLGEQLVGLHLMEKHGPDIAKYKISGDNLVEKVRYTVPGQGAKTGRVWINKEQYFENIRPEVWEFHIGGYQVCEKWLKDRKGRVLSYDDLEHYRHIVSALSETIRIMAEIDICIDKHGGWPIK